MPAAAGELRAQSTEFSSQGVYIESPGVGVRVGPERRRDRVSAATGATAKCVGGGCRTVTVRETLAGRLARDAHALALLISLQSKSTRIEDLAPSRGPFFLCARFLLQGAR